MLLGSSGDRSRTPKVRIRPQGTEATFTAKFLGRAVRPDGGSYLAFLKDGASPEIHLSRMHESVKIRSASGREIRTDDLRSVASPIEQEGPTCMAYAMFHCLRQLDLDGTSGAALSDALSDRARQRAFLERLRTRLYVDANDGRNFSQVMKETADEFGLSATHLGPFSRSFREKVVDDLRRGAPVILKYNVGNEMEFPAYSFVDLSSPAIRNANPLWLPRAAAMWSHGNHAVVASGYFEHEGKHYTMILDSNWDVPQLWNVELFDRHSIAHMEAWALRLSP